MESNFEYLIGAENKFILEHVDGGNQNEYITVIYKKYNISMSNTNNGCNN